MTTKNLINDLQRYRVSLERVAVCITKSEIAAEEVVSSAYFKAWRSINDPKSGFRGESKPKTWLTRIVINEALQWRRRNFARQNREVEIDAAYDGAFDVRSNEDPLRDLIRREKLEKLTFFISNLEPIMRRTLFAYLKAGTLLEAADQLHISISAMKARMRRCRNELRLLVR